MFWQQAYEREAESLTLNNTWKLDLPKFGQLGSLLIRLSGSQASGYGQGALAWRLIDKISKIVVIADAGEVIKSFTGYQLKALEYYDQGMIAPGDWRNYATETQFEYLLINFGRFLHDLTYGLDLSRYDNVQLQITNTATTSDFSAIDISVMGIYLRDVPAGQFLGYLRTEEWQNWTTVAGETKYFNLPVLYPLRRVILQAIPDVDSDFLRETNMSNLMYDIDFTIDTGQVRVYKGGIDDLMRLNVLNAGKPVITAGFPYQTADDGIDMSLGRIWGYAQGAGAKDGSAASTMPTIESGMGHGTLKPETYEGDHPLNVLAVGFAPFYTAMFDFDVNYDPNNWLDPNARKTVRLEILTRNSASAADGYNAILLDRFVPAAG